MIPQEIHQALQERFGDAIRGGRLDGVHNPWISVAPGRVRDIMIVLRDDPRMQFDSLMCLSGVDRTGGKLEVVYHLHSMKLTHTITLKAEVSVESPIVQSIADVWLCANWHEREAYDMFGIVFDGHPDLRRILLPDDWIGHPLRKDYAVQEYYNGMKVPY